ncbi:MAG: hypothetical protein U0361_05860 [Nitrospiraceae bacterium]
MAGRATGQEVGFDRLPFGAFQRADGEGDRFFKFFVRRQSRIRVQYRMERGLQFAHCQFDARLHRAERLI